MIKRLFAVYGSAALLAGVFVWVGELVRGYLVEPVVVLPFLSFEQATNHGFAWGVEAPLLLVSMLGAGAIALLSVLYVRSARKGCLADAAFVLLFAGAFSNVFERIVLSGVTDYVRLWVIPNCNLADISLTVGAAMIVLYGNRILS